MLSLTSPRHTPTLPSPSLRSRWPPQHAQTVGGSITTRLARQRSAGNVSRLGAPAERSARTVVVLAAACSAASSSSVAAGFKFLEVERQLIDQPRRATSDRYP